MDTEQCEILYKEIQDIRKERTIMEKQVQQLDRDVEIKLLQYRIKSVIRVLDYINDKCWKKEEIRDLHNKVVHCLNKLHGNIDGIEIEL